MESYKIIFNHSESMTVVSNSTVHAGQIVKELYKKRFKGDRKRQKVTINSTLLIVGGHR